MENFGQRLKHTLDKQEKTQVALADFLGIAPQSIQKWMKGSTPTMSNVMKIAEFLNVSPVWLLFGTTNDAQSFLVEIPESRVEVLNGKISYPIQNPSNSKAYHNEWLSQKGLNPDRCIRVMVDGDSMQPLLYHGDTVLINLDDTRITDGGVYGLKIDDGFYIRRLASIAGLGIKVVPLNPAYEMSTLDNERFKNRVQIIGRVCDKSGNGGI